MQAWPHNIDIQATQLGGWGGHKVGNEYIPANRQWVDEYWRTIVSCCLVSWSPSCLCWWLPWGQGSRQRERGTLSIWWGEDSFWLYWSSTSILTRYGYMETKEGTAALQTEEGLQRKIKKAVMDFQVWHFFSFHDILIISRHLPVWTRQESWMERHENWWRHQGENFPLTLWCRLTPTA